MKTTPRESHSAQRTGIVSEHDITVRSPRSCCVVASPDLPIRLGTTACAYPSVMATAQTAPTGPIADRYLNCGSALRRGPSVLDELAADVVVLQSVSAGDLDAIDGSLFVGPAGKGLLPLLAVQRLVLHTIA